jgi:hypothetical protein
MDISYDPFRTEEAILKIKIDHKATRTSITDPEGQLLWALKLMNV